MLPASKFGLPNGFVVYNERSLIQREHLVQLIYTTLRDTWQGLNKSVSFERVETPLLLPREALKSHAEVGFELIAAGEDYYLRPETTYGLYLALKGKKLPHCVWQYGKSFRDEALGKFRFSNLRFREFYQLEFELAFAAGTKADYLQVAKKALCGLFPFVLEVPKDLPHYSTETIDLYLQGHETIALSRRTDFEFPVVEVSVGLDRLVWLTLGQTAQVE